MANKAPIFQEKLKARKRKKLFWICVLSFSGIILLFSILSFVSSLDFFQVKDIEVSGATNIEVNTAAAIVERAFEGTTFGFFPRNNIFFVSSREIAQNIKNTFPSVDSVSVSKKYFSTIFVTIEEKKPVALWCLDKSCVDLDSSGEAFQKSASTTSLVVFKTGTAPSIGTSPLPFDSFISLSLFMQNLPERGIYASSVTVNTDGTDNIAISTSTDIIIDPSKDLSKALSNLDRVLNDKTSGISLGTINNLKYIDLRFPDKIFYK